MKEKIEALMAEIAGLTCKTEQEVEEARVRLLGKKGSITALFEEFRTVATHSEMCIHLFNVDVDVDDDEREED